MGEQQASGLPAARIRVRAEADRVSLQRTDWMQFYGFSSSVSFITHKRQASGLPAARTRARAEAASTRRGRSPACSVAQELWGTAPARRGGTPAREETPFRRQGWPAACHWRADTPGAGVPGTVPATARRCRPLSPRSDRRGLTEPLSADGASGQRSKQPPASTCGSTGNLAPFTEAAEEPPPAVAGRWALGALEVRNPRAVSSFRALISDDSTIRARLVAGRWPRPRQGTGWGFWAGLELFGLVQGLQGWSPCSLFLSRVGALWTRPRAPRLEPLLSYLSRV